MSDKSTRRRRRRRRESHLVAVATTMARAPGGARKGGNRKRDGADGAGDYRPSPARYTAAPTALPQTRWTRKVVNKRHVLQLTLPVIPAQARSFKHLILTNQLGRIVPTLSACRPSISSRSCSDAVGRKATGTGQDGRAKRLLTTDVRQLTLPVIPVQARSFEHLRLTSLAVLGSRYTAGRSGRAVRLPGGR